jgi:hypothetical protein
MAVLDGSWWALWWPWMLVWLGTVVSALVAGTIAVIHWRRDRKTIVQRSSGIVFYLNDKRVMEVYHRYGGPFTEALSQEVERRTSKDRKTEGTSKLGPLEFTLGGTVTKEEVRKFIEVYKPITVISVVIDALDRAGDIVDVDLNKGEVIWSPARATGLGHADELPKEVRLGEVENFVFVRGLFRRFAEDASTITLQAPYGPSADLAKGPQVHIVCAKNGLSALAVPTTGHFLARCLGSGAQWEAQTHRLVLDPIAIFR